MEIIVGALLGLLLSLFAQPLLNEPAQSFLVRLIGRLSIVRGKTDVAGLWQFVWCIDGQEISRAQEHSLRLRTVGTKVAGKFTWHDRTYQMIGNRYTTNHITGTYVDQNEGNVFHGSFQLRVLPKDKLMEGRWMGFDSDHTKILSGPWYLRQQDQPTYYFENRR